MLKRNCNILFVFILIGLLSACSSAGNDKADDSETKDNFTGVIETIEDKNAIVDIEDGEILKSGLKVSMNLSVAGDTTFQVGYDGEVREREPLGINTSFVELIE